MKDPPVLGIFWEISRPYNTLPPTPRSPSIAGRLSILGEVFDVSKGAKHYGRGGGYQGFTGRDASRAFVTGDFTEVKGEEIRERLM